MRIFNRGTVGLVALTFVVSCNALLKKIKKGEEEAGVPEASVALDDAGEPTPEPAPPALASNEGDVARFPDETKLPDVHARTQRPYNVREAPPNGELIVNIPKGTEVTQIAQRDRFFLITFDDPRASGTKLMGWIHADAFSPNAPNIEAVKCSVKGEVPLMGDAPFCGVICKTDADCPKDQVCKGSANKYVNGKPGEKVNICILFHPHDAGAPPQPPQTDAGGGGGRGLVRVPKDAGAPPVVDAGPAPNPAPNPPAPSGPAQDVVAANGTSCPANFVFVKKTGKCHRPCTNAVNAERECKNRPFFCIKCDNDTKVVCAESKTQCK
jgi:hypothetical protein